MRFDDLRTRLAGELSCVGEAGHGERRGEMVWNQLATPARPAAIARVASTADVVQCVQFARTHGLQVSVRGGGHHWSGTPLREGALLLDLSRLSALTIDPVARTGRIEPAVNARDFARQLAPHGLAFPCGHCPSVALSGFLLGGGLGWNQGMWGPGCANIEAVEVVTAQGEVVVADAEHEPELLWAARGAGPGFCGVVTHFDLRLHALPRAMRTRMFAYPLARIGEIAQWLEVSAERMATCVELVVCIAAAPPELAAALRDSNGMACFVIVTAFADDEAQAQAALSPFADDAVPPATLMQTAVEATDFDALFDGVDRLFPPAHRYLADTFWSKVPAAEALAVTAAAYARAPSRSSLALAVFGLPRGDVDALYLPGGLLTISYGVWAEAVDDERNRAWHGRLVERLEALSAAHYVGEADLGARGRAERCYTAASWQRLQRVRQHYDPDEIFCGFPPCPPA